MPYVKGWAEVTVWVPPGRPTLPDRPDWRPETGLPGVPDTGGPGRPPWADWERPERPGQPLPPQLPGRPDWWPEVGGGPVLPERPTFPGFPERPGRPGGGWYFAPEPGEVGGHPELPDLDESVFGYVSYPKGRAGYPAWITAPDALRRRMFDDGEDGEDEGPEVQPPGPRHPTVGLPGEWRVVTNGDGSVLTWAWLLSMPDRTPEVEPPDPEEARRR